MIKAERKAQLLENARVVFSNKGYHKTSISDIINKSGVARGTFYLYFENKRQVFESVLDELFRDIGDCIKTIQLGKGHASPIDQLRNNVRSVIALLLSNPETTDLLLKHAFGVDPEFDEKLNQFYNRLAERLESSLQLGIAMGLLRKCDTQIVSFCIMGTIKEVVASCLSDVQYRGKDIDLIVDEVLNFGSRGLITSEYGNT